MEKLLSPLLNAFAIAAAARHRCPPSRRVPRSHLTSSALATPSFRIDQRPYIFETICCHQPCRDEFPQSIFGFARQAPRRARQVREEERTFPLQSREHFTSRMRQGFGICRSGSCGKNPRSVLTEKQRNRRDACGTNLPAFTVLQRRDAETRVPTSLHRRNTSRPAASARTSRCGKEGSAPPTLQPEFHTPAVAV